MEAAMVQASGEPDRPVAFVLSGGGSIGAIQVGMIQALYERGIAPDLIVAASVGALNGAFIASRPATVDTAGQLAEVWSKLRTRTVFPVAPALGGVLGALGYRNHVASTQGLRTLLGRWLEFDDLAVSPIPLHLIATDRDERRRAAAVARAGHRGRARQLRAARDIPAGPVGRSRTRGRRSH